DSAAPGGPPTRTSSGEVATDHRSYTYQRDRGPWAPIAKPPNDLRARALAVPPHKERGNPVSRAPWGAGCTPGRGGAMDPELRGLALHRVFSRPMAMRAAIAVPIERYVTMTSGLRIGLLERGGS